MEQILRRALWEEHLFRLLCFLFPAWNTEVTVEAPQEDVLCPSSVASRWWRRKAAGACLPGRIPKLPSQLCVSSSLQPLLWKPEPSFVSAAEARLYRPQLLTAAEDRNGITSPGGQRPCLFFPSSHLCNNQHRDCASGLVSGTWWDMDAKVSLVWGHHFHLLQSNWVLKNEGRHVSSHRVYGDTVGQKHLQEHRLQLSASWWSPVFSFLQVYFRAKLGNEKLGLERSYDRVCHLTRELSACSLSLRGVLSLGWMFQGWATLCGFSVTFAH